MFKKYVVIGGGVTGLGFCNFVNNNDVILFEKENELGGYCRTIYKNDFIWDYAGHFFHFSNSKIMKLFYDNISTDEIIKQRKQSLIYWGDRFIDFPFQKNIHQLSKQEFIDCLYYLFKNQKNESSNFIEMLYSKYGEGITEKFLKPYNEKLYACNLNRLDKEAMGRFFPHSNKTEIILNMKNQEDSSYNKVFYYPKKGAITYINSISQNVSKEAIYLNEKVTEISPIEKLIRTKNHTVHYEYLISTIPLNRLIKMIKGGIEKKPHLLKSNKVLVFNIGFNKPSLLKNKVHWIYVPQKEIIFYRVGFYNHILDTEKLSVYVEIGYPKSKPIDINVDFSKVLEGLMKLWIIDEKHIIEASCHLILDPAYVHITQESENYKKRLFKKLKKHDIYSIGRYGGWKYCSIEDNIIEAQETAKGLK